MVPYDQTTLNQTHPHEPTAFTAAATTTAATLLALSPNPSSLPLRNHPQPPHPGPATLLFNSYHRFQRRRPSCSRKNDWFAAPPNRKGWPWMERRTTRRAQGVVGAPYVCAATETPFPPHSDLSRFPTGLCPCKRTCKDNVPPETVLRHHRSPMLLAARKKTPDDLSTDACVACLCFDDRLSSKV